MLTDYIAASMRRAKYEILNENEGYFGRIPGFDGVWANAPTLEACREELAEVLEEWILLGLSEGHILPIVDGIDLAIRESA
ncbi:MAG: type II toxin-antitoxin system HicB family antitoxin [Bryobacteraceae bacterium]